MSRRRKTSKGQAIVLVTLALIAMAGLMGLAVDLGWSFFVKKQAQAAADAAAFAAVQEAIMRMGGLTSSFAGCPVAPSGRTGLSAVYCTAVPGNPVPCSSFTATSDSNLSNGCLYAAKNGFSSSNTRQKVTIQANDKTNPPPTVSGISNIVYWVTVRTVQTIPQLFSSLMGNTEGTVSAIATAGIVSTVVKGDVILLNQKGDCMGSGDCGMDVNLQGNSTIDATGTIVLSSTCDGSIPPLSAHY